MALVDTADKQEILELKDKQQLARTLQGAMADELSASNLYDKLIGSLMESDIDLDKKTKDEILEKLTEIKNDEHNHFGILLGIVASLDPDAGMSEKAGIIGKEVDEMDDLGQTIPDAIDEKLSEQTKTFTTDDLKKVFEEILRS